MPLIKWRELKINYFSLIIIKDNFRKRMHTVHKFNAKQFFLILMVLSKRATHWSLCHRLLECYMDCKLIALKVLDWWNKILKWIEGFHSTSKRAWGFFSNVLVFKGIQLPEGASKSSSEELQGLHGWLRIRRHQETLNSKGI